MPFWKLQAASWPGLSLPRGVDSCVGCGIAGFSSQEGTRVGQPGATPGSHKPRRPINWGPALSMYARARRTDGQSSKASPARPARQLCHFESPANLRRRWPARLSEPFQRAHNKCARHRMQHLPPQIRALMGSQIAIRGGHRGEPCAQRASSLRSGATRVCALSGGETVAGQPLEGQRRSGRSAHGGDVGMRVPGCQTCVLQGSARVPTLVAPRSAWRWPWKDARGDGPGTHG
ncbi:uncharacterized protein LOC124108468 [Marmota monax]|uniref:uncharacterized protein LOC124108468 n=1 Tax=Marmota monax TaxID=9995 RepID=UPI001EAFD823|nr:uncharacterized protein LOC124108468 [Marmota monax]